MCLMFPIENECVFSSVQAMREKTASWIQTSVRSTLVKTVANVFSVQTFRTMGRCLSSLSLSSDLRMPLASFAGVCQDSLVSLIFLFIFLLVCVIKNKRTESFSLCVPPLLTGHNCSVDVNECESSPCQNEGNCQDLINSYQCECLDGFTGGKVIEF